jgi:ABC-type glycerol-3-phosphate transport system substrate-binding protein
MFKNKKFLQSLASTIVIGLLWAACAPTPAAVKEIVEVEKEATPVVEVEKEVEQVVEAPVKTQTIRLLVAGRGEEVQVLEEQIDRFQEAHPDIEVLLEFVPYGESEVKVLTMMAAGVPPDVAVLSYNFYIELQEQGYLAALDERAAQIDLGDFIQDALQSGGFGRALYGLPWQRSGCWPHYRYLALFDASTYHDAAFALMDFLTQPEQQSENYLRLQWYPTRKSVYGERAIECPTIEAIRLAPEEVAGTVSLVRDLQPVLQGVLGGQAINPYEATAVIEDGALQGTGAPVMNPISAEEFEAALAEGVAIGALSVDQAPEYPPGDYAVWCQDDGEARCYLVPPQGEQVEVDLEVFERTEDPVVGQPLCTVITGSKKLCFRLDSRQICFRIG